MTTTGTKTSLADLGRAAQQATDTTEGQVTFMIRELRGDAALTKLLWVDIVRLAALKVLNGLNNQSRKTAKGMTVPGHCTRSDAAIASACGTPPASFLRTWRMSDGRSLYDVRGRELAPLAAGLENRAQGIQRNAQFYRLLDGHVPARAKVGTQVSDEKAIELWRETAVIGKKEAS